MVTDIKIHRMTPVTLPEVVERTLGEVPVYVLGGATEPVLHLELIFRAGRAQAVAPHVANAAAALLTDGTHAMSSGQIAEAFEFMGATLKAHAGTDALSVSLYCLSKKFVQALDLLSDIIQNAQFPPSEVDQYIAKRLQKLQIAQQRNEYLVSQGLLREIFAGHVYGSILNADQVRSIDRPALLAHLELLGTSNLSIFLSGKVERDHLTALERFVHSLRVGEDGRTYSAPEPAASCSTRIDAPNKMQCAIRLGRQAVGKTHPDYCAVFVLNTLFGGFFGSRLMKNIREEKGLTYGIYSSFETLAKGSCLLVGTEAATQYEQEVIAEIRAETQRLQDKLVDTSELEMVQNYLVGSLMMCLDGPLKSMEVVKSMVIESVPLSRFNEISRGLNEVTATQLQEAAQQYLNLDDWHHVIVA